MNRGKSVFVEKPLAVTKEELREIVKGYAPAAAKGVHVMVGFNRRFSGPFNDMREFLAQSTDAMTINYRVNAGTLPASHWLHDPAQGGRIVGEACHFVDCMEFLTGARPTRVFAESVPRAGSPSGVAENVSVTIRYSDGSVGNLVYLADGDSAVGKEYCEVHRGGMTVIMQNFEEVNFSHQGKRSRKRYDGTKGHKEELEKTIEAFGAGREPISFESLCTTTEVTFKILESLHCGQPVEVRH
jgi:polar amino acid transport system substrate-binding protein